MGIFSNLKIVVGVWVAFIVLLGVLYVVNLKHGYEKIKNKSMQCNLQLAIQNAAIDKQKQQVLFFEKKLKEEQLQAAEISKSYDRKLHSIENEKVPTECASAMHYGILKAGEI